MFPQEQEYGLKFYDIRETINLVSHYWNAYDHLSVNITKISGATALS